MPQAYQNLTIASRFKRTVSNIFYRSEDICLPLYEGKMIWHFDHRAGTYEGQTQAQANLGTLPEPTDEQYNDPSFLPLPRYWINKFHLPKLMRDGRKAFLVFRDVTGPAHARTAAFCILPVLPCNHKLPIVLLDPKHSREIAYLAACFSSFVLDYVVRQKLGGYNMGLFILKQLPVLLPNQYDAKCKWNEETSLGDWIWFRALELTYTSWNLVSFAKDSGYDGPPFHWSVDRRFLLRCELDAAYFHLYGIEHDDVDYIMETFRVVKQRDEKQYEVYRTKRVILEIYDEMKRAMETGEAYRTRLEPPPADPAVAHAPRERVDTYL